MQKRREFLRSMPAMALATSATQDIQKIAYELQDLLAHRDGARWRVSFGGDFILLAREPLEHGSPDPGSFPSKAS